MRFHIAAAAIATLFSTHALQGGGECTSIRLGTHDFDQVRDDLPGGGGSYCYPTSMIDWMAYLNQNGFPSAMLTGAAVDWSDPSHYDQVTTLIQLMGVFCDTQVGQGSLNAVGFESYLDFVGLGDGFHVVTQAVDWFDQDEDYQPYLSPGWMSYYLRSGGLPAIGIGWFTFSNGAYRADGAHVVVVPAVVGECDDLVMLIHDPGTGGDDATTQSPYDYTQTTLSLVTGNFRAGNSPVLAKSIWQLDAYGDGKAFYKGLRVLYPNSSWALPPTFDHMVSLTAWESEEDQEPVPTFIAFPEGHVAGAIEPHASGLGTLLTTTGADGSVLWWYDAADEVLIALPDLDPDPGPLAVDRFGNAWIVRNGLVEIVDVVGGGGAVDWSLVTRITPEVPPTALVYCDEIDIAVGVGTDASGPLLQSFTPTDGLLGAWTLAEAAALEPPYVMAPSSGGDGVWIGAENSFDVFFFDIDVLLGHPTLRDVVRLPGLPRPTSIQQTDTGRLLVVSDGTSHEYTYDEQLDEWVETDLSRFAGVEGLAILRTTRSRDGSRRFADPADDPDLPHVLPQDAITPCPGDLDHDGRIAVPDLLVLLAGWGPCDLLCPGDADDDHDADVADLLIVLAGWGACP